MRVKGTSKEKRVLWCVCGRRVFDLSVHGVACHGLFGSPMCLMPFQVGMGEALSLFVLGMMFGLDYLPPHSIYSRQTHSY